jgi:ferric iron reductase protein FhuF
VTAILCRAGVPSALTPVLNALAVMRAVHGDSVVAGIAPAIVVQPEQPVPLDGSGPLDGSRPRPAQFADRRWLPATGLLNSPAALDALIDAAKQRWNAPDHVAASLAFKAYARWLALPAVLGYATARRIPDVTPDNVVYRFDASTKHLVTIGLRDYRTTELADDAALLAVLRDTLLDQHLDPLVEQIRNRVHIGRRTLLGSLASAIGLLLSRSADALPGSTLDTATAVLSTLDIADLVTMAPQPGGRLDVQRRTCCLAFTLPEPKFCGGCCVPSADSPVRVT